VYLEAAVDLAAFSTGRAHAAGVAGPRLSHDALHPALGTPLWIAGRPCGPGGSVSRAPGGAGREPETESGETSVKRQKAQIKATYESIQTRAQTVLDEPQFERFQTLVKQEVLRRQNSIREPFWGRTAPFYHWLTDLYFF